MTLRCKSSPSQMADPEAVMRRSTSGCRPVGSQELQRAELGHGGRGGRHGEAVALVLALMAECSAGPNSRRDSTPPPSSTSHLILAPTPIPTPTRLRLQPHLPQTHPAVAPGAPRIYARRVHARPHLPAIRLVS